METNLLSKYSQSPYVIIGLDLTKNHFLPHFNNEQSLEIKQIFDTLDDCENFIVNLANDDKLVVIINDHLVNEQLTKLQNYSQIDVIYLYLKTSDLKEELKCLYTKPTTGKYWKIIIKLLKKFWFILSLLVCLVFAYFFPKLGASNGPLHAEYTIKWGCVIIIFFLNGLSLSTRNLADQMFHFRLHILIQIYSLLVFPCTVYGIALLLDKSSINKLLINGIILMACTSTAVSTSVIMTKNAGGNEVASLLNGLLGNILGIFISPALIYLFMKNTVFGVGKQQYDIGGYVQVIGKLSLTVLLPLIVGQIINRIWTEKVLWAKVKFYFTEVNSVALLILVWSVLCNLFQSGLLSTVSTFDLLAVIVLNALFYISFTLLALFIVRLPNLFICRKDNHNAQPSLLEHQQTQLTLIERWRFSREDTIAIMFCGSTKTLAQGVPLITAVFVNSNQGLIGLLIIPLILYFVEQLMLGSIEVLLLQRWIKLHRNDNIKQLLQQENISSDIVTNL